VAARSTATARSWYGPQYDWVGKFSDNRAAVRLGGLYGFVDEEGRDSRQAAISHRRRTTSCFAQVDVDGQSG